MEGEEPSVIEGGILGIFPVFFFFLNGVIMFIKILLWVNTNSKEPNQRIKIQAI